MVERTISLLAYSGGTYTPPYPYPLHDTTNFTDLRPTLAGNPRAVSEWICSAACARRTFPSPLPIPSCFCTAHIGTREQGKKWW